ncbi:MAG: phosphoribosyltransferase, partial [Flavobacteriaceae bacterium]|nr:phosphoribosyltransferase [Flavobacteriaceae bacterium]
MNDNSNTVILNKKQIEHKIKRIAYQIYEANIEESEVIIAGIRSNGFLFAKKLKNTVEAISPIKVLLCEVTIDKKNPIAGVATSIEENRYKDRSLILV